MCKSQTTFEHLWRSLGASPEALFAMLTLYCDEAGGESERFIVVCGWVASVLQWQQFEYNWRLFLAKYNVPYFHMKEYSQSVGAFKQWKGKEGTRRAFIRDAASIIGDTIQRGFVCYVNYDVFEKADRNFELREMFNSPYALAGRTCVAFANDWRRKNNSALEMEYVFEDGGQSRASQVDDRPHTTPSNPIV